MVHMIHEDRTNESDPSGPDIRTFPFFVKLHMAMSLASSIFFRVPSRFPLGKCVQNFLAVLRLGWVKPGTSKESCAIRCRKVAGSGRNVPGPTAEGEGFRVGFPRRFCVRNSIQDSLGRLSFLINLHQNQNLRLA